MRDLAADLPKPLIPVGGLPVLAHVISIYLWNGIRDIVVLGGHRFDQTLGFFSGLERGAVESVPRGKVFRQVKIGAWPAFDVAVLDTGATTETGGRLLAAADCLRERFCLTYGDSLVDFDLRAALAVHDAERTQATVSVYRHPFPYGTVALRGNRVAAFEEKKLAVHLSAGFFVLEPEVLKLIPGADSAFEKTALPALAAANQLAANGAVSFWHPMDTKEDRDSLERIYASTAPDVPWLRVAR